MKYQIDNIIKVRVSAIEKYGAFVITEENYKGLIHISEINGKFIRDINEYFKIGDVLFAKILGIDEEKKQLKLTLKNIENTYNHKRDNLEETKLGFSLLKDLLPKWIDEKLNEIQKNK